MFAAHEEFADKSARNAARTVAADESGVPMRVMLSDSLEVFERARLVQNTVQVDPHAPTMAEVRAILDEVADDPAAAVE